jgi:hypothetical protein
MGTLVMCGLVRYYRLSQILNKYLIYFKNISLVYDELRLMNKI